MTDSHTAVRHRGARPTSTPWRAWALLLGIGLAACGGSPPPQRPTPEWASICGRHCAGAPVQVAVGGHHVCLRYAGGAMICWGEVRGRADDIDPLRVATEVDEPALNHDDPRRATTLVPGMLDVTDMACGDGFCCAIERDLGLACWGLLNRWSAPGVHPPPDDPRVPEAVPGASDASALIGHGVEALAATTPTQDMLAVGDSNLTRTPASDWPHAPVSAVAYSSGGPTLVADGHVYAMCLEPWHGECGGADANSVDSHLPAFLLPVSYLDDAIDVASWGHTRCALRATGEVWCWGDARVIWEQGDPSEWDRPQPTWAPTRVDALSGIVGLEASDHAFCALRADHQLLCWGIDTSGILRTGHEDGERWTPFPLPDAADVVAFDLSDQALCVTRLDGEVACSDLLPPDAPTHSHPRGRLVPIPGLPDLPGDFTDEPSPRPTTADAGA